MKKDLIIFAVVAFAVMLPIAYGFVTHSGNYFSVTDNVNYRVSGLIASSGDMSMSSANYKMSVVIGQPLVDKATSTNYKVDLGFFFGEVSENFTDIKLSGTLRYDNGTAVANSEIRGVVSYAAESFEDTTMTNDSGYFELSIRVPERFMQYKFLLEIYVAGDVDAMYSCYYCPATRQCLASPC